jgi:hypothetical protein
VLDTNTTGFLESRDFCAAIRKLVDSLVIFFVCICTYICTSLGLGLFVCARELVGVRAISHVGRRHTEQSPHILPLHPPITVPSHWGDKSLWPGLRTQDPHDGLGLHEHHAQRGPVHC